MNPQSSFEEAQKYEASGKLAQAAASYKKLVASSQDARFHIAYGRCLQQFGHWEQSVVQFERGLELKPHYCGSDARLMLAESYLKVGSKPKAIREWHIVAGMKPEYPSYEATINAATELLQRNA